MRRAAYAALLVLGVAVVGRVATAADFYSGKALVPGADAGTTAMISLNDAGVGPGVQFMVYSPTYPVQYRLCKQQVPSSSVPLATCTATSNDQVIPADTAYDICGLPDHDGFSVFKAYDAGNPTVRLYRVSPQSKDCLP